jgi:hypothetical protein
MGYKQIRVRLGKRRQVRATGAERAAPLFWQSTYYEDKTL